MNINLKDGFTLMGLIIFAIFAIMMIAAFLQ